MFLVACAIMFSSQVPAADAKCYGLPNPPRSNTGQYIVGEKQFGGSVTYGAKAISALIFNYDPWVIHNTPHWFTGDPYDQASTAWVGFGDNEDLNWAQIGWIEHAGLYDRYTFTQHTIPVSPYIITWEDPNPPKYFPEGQSTVYAIYDSDYWVGYFSMRAGAPSLEGAPPPIENLVPKVFTPVWGSMGGEVTSGANQMPGGWMPGYRDTFYAAYLKDYLGVWHNVNEGEVGWSAYNWWPQEFSRYDLAPHPVYGGGAFQIWDNRCQY